jgi:hypothetical protein
LKRLSSVLAGSVVVALAAALGACDPVHSDEIAALGDEAPGVKKGPLHRPGQPCQVCHDGSVGSPPEFTVAGTIYKNEGDTVGVVSASVVLTSVNGDTYTAVTNSVGNFYVTPRQFTPTYPMRVSVKLGTVTVKMTSLVGRNASCATCHFDPAGPTSAGRVFVPADGGTP